MPGIVFHISRLWRQRERTLHGVVSRPPPKLCVAAVAASGDCFDATTVEDPVPELAVGDCVVVRFTAKDNGRPITLLTVRKEACLSGGY